MTIVMIHGPDGGRMRAPAMEAALDERARTAGRTLLQVRCDTAGQLVERLARMDREGTDILLLDPGRCPADGALHATLEHLPVPCIEVHPDSRHRAETRLPAAGPRVAMVDGYQGKSYPLAMSLALERLGCADCENEFNVGT